jgi:hypothetical protein
VAALRDMLRRLPVIEEKEGGENGSSGDGEGGGGASGGRGEARHQGEGGRNLDGGGRGGGNGVGLWDGTHPDLRCPPPFCGLVSSKVDKLYRQLTFD